MITWLIVTAHFNLEKARKSVSEKKRIAGAENMNRDKLLEQLAFYRKLVEEKGNIIERLRNSIDEMRKEHNEFQSYVQNFLKQIAELTEKLYKALSTIGNLEQKLSDYDSRNDLNNQRRLAKKSEG